MATVKLWLPAGLDLRPVMAAAGMESQTIYAEWLLSEVTRWRALYRVPSGQFVPLAFAHLESVIPRNLIRRLKRALIPGFLETDGRYWFGPGGPGECAGYRLATTCTPEVVTRFSVTLGRKLAAADARRAAEDGRRAAALDPLHRQIREHVRSAWLTDDAKADDHPVVEFLTGVRQGWFVVCGQGRVHHPVASCPRRLRPHLRLADARAPLAIIDVSACQPLLLGLLAHQNGATKPPTQTDRPAGGGQPAGGKPKDRNDAHLYSHPSHACPFISVCLDGTLYETMAETMTEISGRRRYTRERAKKRWMGVVYGRHGLMARKLTGRALQRLFPVFFERVRRMAAAGEHGHLARQMQRLESGLVIRGVVAELFRAHPGVTVVPIHDAILTHAAHAETVRAVFREVFHERLNVIPRLKVEPIIGLGGGAE